MEEYISAVENEALPIAAGIRYKTEDRVAKWVMMSLYSMGFAMDEFEKFFKKSLNEFLIKHFWIF